jgi:hypothetical protein
MVRMSDPKPVTFYYAGELPAHTEFFGDDSMTESFELDREFKLSNPQHVAHATQLVNAGILSKTPPKPAKKSEG